jgi:hypothetical protein
MLKMEVICSSETSVGFQQTTQHYILEARTLHNHRCENLNSYRFKLFFPPLRWNAKFYTHTSQQVRLQLFISSSLRFEIKDGLHTVQSVQRDSILFTQAWCFLFFGKSQ